MQQSGTYFEQTTHLVYFTTVYRFGWERGVLLVCHRIKQLRRSFITCHGAQQTIVKGNVVSLPEGGGGRGGLKIIRIRYLSYREVISKEKVVGI